LGGKKLRNQQRGGLNKKGRTINNLSEKGKRYKGGEKRGKKKTALRTLHQRKGEEEDPLLVKEASGTPNRTKEGTPKTN